MTAEASDPRITAAVELLLRIAAGHLDARATPSEQGDELDAILGGLNMLAEELDHERQARLRAEELLHDEVDAYEQAPAFFCSVDASTLVVEKCNTTLANALGLSKAELLGRSVLELFVPEHRAEFERLLREGQGGEAGPPLELRLKVRTGGALVVDTSWMRVRTGAGRERLRLIWRDITAEKKLESQLLQAQKMEAVGRLSGGVAHDFNNVLSVILSSASFVRSQLREHALPTDDLDLIDQAAQQGAALTNDLLAFSRRRVVKAEPTDVRSAVAEAERMARRVVGDTIRVTTEVSVEPLVCVIDPTQLLQVLVNLIINGRDAMPDGGTLTVEASRFDVDERHASTRFELVPGPYALLAVSDTGSGMPPEVVAQAFEPFFTTKPVGKGSGLGLSMSYGIIRQAGGHIWIYSEVGKGTTIKMYLPLATRAPVSHASPVPTAHGGRETVLVVEDDAAVRGLTARILSGAGYHVLTAEHGRAGLQVAAQFKGDIALLVTDVMMPEMGGHDLALALRDQRPSTRVLYLSGYTANVIVRQGVLKPDIDFLAKPFTPTSLLATVRKVLDRLR